MIKMLAKIQNVMTIHKAVMKRTFTYLVTLEQSLLFKLILCRRDFKQTALNFFQSRRQDEVTQLNVSTLSSVRSLHRLRAETDFRAFVIFSTC